MGRIAIFGGTVLALLVAAAALGASGTPEVVARIPGFVGPANLRYGAGAVWVGAQLGHKIFRIDARTNKVTAIRVGEGPRSLAASKTAIWVSNRLSDSVWRLDPRTRKVLAKIHV